MAEFRLHLRGFRWGTGGARHDRFLGQSGLNLKSFLRVGDAKNANCIICIIKGFWD